MRNTQLQKDNSKTLYSSFNKASIVKYLTVALIVVVLLQSLKLSLFYSSSEYWHLIKFHIINLCAHLGCFFTVLIFLKYQLNYMARQFLLLSFNSYLIFACYLWKVDVNLHYYFLLAMFIACYLFTEHEQNHLILWGIIEVVLFLASHFLLFDNSLLLEAEILSKLNNIASINAVFFTFACCVCAWFIQRIISHNWQERLFLQACQQQLLQKIFPLNVANDLLQTIYADTQSLNHKREDKKNIEEQYTHQLQKSSKLAVLFLDICDFTSIEINAKEQSWQQIYALFSQYDKAIEHLDAKRIKVNGDQYILLIGLHISQRNLPQADQLIAKQALLASRCISNVSKVAIRQGIAFGVVTYGIFDVNKPLFDIWGETVILASRLESLASKGSIYCDQQVYQLSKHQYTFNSLKKPIKGMGYQTIYELKQPPEHSNSSDE